MDTHPDRDAKAAGIKRLFEENTGAADPPHVQKDLAELEAKARDMRERGESQITGGKPGEKPIKQEQVGGIFIRQMPEDPHCLRISIGAGHRIGDSAYFVFRGDPQDIHELLVRAKSALEASHFQW